MLLCRSQVAFTETPGCSQVTSSLWRALLQLHLPCCLVLAGIKLNTFPPESWKHAKTVKRETPRVQGCLQLPRSPQLYPLPRWRSRNNISLARGLACFSDLRSGELALFPRVILQRLRPLATWEIAWQAREAFLIVFVCSYCTSSPGLSLTLQKQCQIKFKWLLYNKACLERLPNESRLSFSYLSKLNNNEITVS